MTSFTFPTVAKAVTFEKALDLAEIPCDREDKDNTVVVLDPEYEKEYHINMDALVDLCLRIRKL